MKKIILILTIILCLLLIPSFSKAAEVCVAVDFSDDKDFVDNNRYSDCFDVNTGTSAESVLQQTSLNIGLVNSAQFGSFICTIDSIGGTLTNNSCSTSGSWSFFVANKGNWVLSSTGISNYQVKDNDVLGFKFDPSFSDSNIPKPNMLRFKEIKVEVDGDKDSSADENGGSIDKDLGPGSIIDFDVEIENLWDSSTDIDMEEPELEWEISDIDDGDEIDGDEDFDDISADKDDQVSFKIEIPLEVEEEDFDMFIIVEAQDSKDITHKIRVDFVLEIKKEKNDVRILNVILNPMTVDCSRNSELRFTVMNVGENEEDDVNVLVTNNDIGLNFNDMFDLDDKPFDDDNRESVRVPINVKDDVKAGNYPIKIKVEYDDGKDEITKTENLIVKDCGSTSVSLSNNNQNTNVVVDNNDQQDIVVVKTQPNTVKVSSGSTGITAGAIAQKVIPQSVESSKDNWPIILLILEGLAVLVLIIIIVTVVVRRKR